MKKGLLFSLGILVTVLVVIQFFQPEPNDSPPGPDDIFTVSPQITPEIRNMMVASCTDCHSNQTNYPWYGRIAPVAWILGSHIREGKEQLNLSEWGSLSDRKKISALQDMAEVVEKGEMPLKGYTRFHPNARLSADQLDKLIHWLEEESMRILTR